MQIPTRGPKIFRQILSRLAEEGGGEIDRELPFAALLFTILAASEVTLYESWKKLSGISHLPKFQKEAKEVVRQVEVLGYDPLTVMQKRAEKTKSKNYREFLLGYVSAVRSGGSIVNYLRSKLRSIFEVQSAAAVRSVERLGTIVEAYAVMLIVTLCSYILFIVFSATSLIEPIKAVGMPGIPTWAVAPLVFIVNPMISVIFMAVAHVERKSNFIGLKKPYKIAVISTAAVCCFMALIFLAPPLQHLTSPETLPLIVTACLLTISIPPAVIYREIAKINYAAENAMPSFLRDVTEARKTGLSPEKSIIHATKRSGYGRFSEVLRLIRSQMEWGVPLRKVFANVKRKIQTWPVLVNFLILVETIKTGGGSAIALEILTEHSEKQKDVETNKRSMLRPYVILAFIWSVLIALTTTMVATTVYALTQLPFPGVAVMPFQVVQEQMILFSVGILFQCWLSGFFVGKVNEGTFAAGFKYSIMLVLTAHVSLELSRVILSGVFGLVS
ncbi:MAG: type II secretion system F family protein [Nitrososphaerota archaeon]|nr:type II secretion system F family protein [Candidatus Bathyarchaeota archaeon]MDW8022547.1 type II secretion system F family protein [Nitrososphaerota archaeon]